MDCVFVVYLGVPFCFLVYVELLNCVHESAFGHETDGFHDRVHRVDGVVMLYEVFRKFGFSVAQCEVSVIFSKPGGIRAICLPYVVLMAIRAR
jgi:hypothetical protein